ncbi:MAG: DUF4149 domain-containing protein [Verrucomicrobiota bacterium]
MPTVIGFLRFFGLLNAAVWLGATVSFSIALGPAFFSQEMKSLLPPPYNGAAAQIVISRYFILLHCCGVVGLLHLFLETLYLGKALERLTLALLTIIISFGLFGGFWLQPKLRVLHLKKYDGRSSVERRGLADRSFKVWHGVSQTMNLFVMGGLFVYLWRVSNSVSTSRFSSANKFRS